MENNFGFFLSKKRKEANLTQKQLAEKLYVSESTISKWEKNKANPDITVIPTLSKILNVSEHELISASIDKSERKQSKDAKKWRTFSTTVDLIFICSYVVALLTCFIVNLSVSGTLSWFFIVLLSVLLSASLTTLPFKVKKYKVLISSLTFLITYVLLILTIVLYSGGKWFYLAVLPTILFFIIVMIPIYIGLYNVPKFLKNNNALISILIDISAVIGFLYYINSEFDGSWFIDFGLKIPLYAFICPLFMVIVIRYLKVNSLLKTGLTLFLFIPFFIGGYVITKDLFPKNFKGGFNELTHFDFLNWSTDEIIGSNVCAIILFIILFFSITFMTFGLIKSKKVNR